MIGLVVTRHLDSFDQHLATRIFIDMFFGLVIIVTAYSVFVTSGITINSGYVLLFVLYLIYKKFYNLKQSPPIASTSSGIVYYKGVYLELVIVISVFFIAQMYPVIDTTGEVFYMPTDPDRSLFSDIISFINSTGIESYKIDYINPNSVGVSPYHYFELWVTGFISVLFSSNIILTDHLVSAPIFGVIIYFGLRAISEILGVPRMYSIVASFLVVAMNSEVQIPWIDQQHSLLERTEVYFQLSVMEYHKFFVIFLFQIAAIIFYNKKQNILALLCLLSTPLANILMAPSFLLSAAIILFVAYYLDKISKKQFYFGIVATLSVALFIVLFYQIFGVYEISSNVTDHGRLISEVVNSIFTITSINIIIGSLIMVVYMLFPFIVLSIWIGGDLLKFSKDIKIVTPVFLWTFIVLFTGLLSWVVLHKHHESTQFFIRHAHVAINLVSFIIVMLAFGKNKYISWIFLIIIFLVKLDYSYEELNSKKTNSSDSYSQDFLSDVAEEFSVINPKGAFIKHKSALYSRRSKSVLSRIGHFTNIYASTFYLHPMNISNFTDSFSNNYIEGIIEKSDVDSLPFYKFVNNQIYNDQFDSINKSQYDFIIRNKINYLILSPLAILPSNIEGLVQTFYVDKNSGERVYILRTDRISDTGVI
jgi:hypothetical protein